MAVTTSTINNSRENNGHGGAIFYTTGLVVVIMIIIAAFIFRIIQEVHEELTITRHYVVGHQLVQEQAKDYLDENLSSIRGSIERLNNTQLSDLSPHVHYALVPYQWTAIQPESGPQANTKKRANDCLERGHKDEKKTQLFNICYKESLDALALKLPVHRENVEANQELAITIGKPSLARYVTERVNELFKPTLAVISVFALLALLTLFLRPPSLNDGEITFGKKTIAFLVAIIASAGLTVSTIALLSTKDDLLTIAMEASGVTTLEGLTASEFMESREIVLASDVPRVADPRHAAAVWLNSNDSSLTQARAIGVGYAKESSGSRAGATPPTLDSLLSSEQFRGSLFGLLAKLLSTTVIGLLLFAELLILLSKYLERRSATASSRMRLHYSIMRPAAFLFVLGIDISMSFLPLYMDTISQPMFGLSRDVIMGLPVSAEFLCVGIAILISGAWLDRRGWREPFVVGLVITSVGLLYSWLAPDAIQFILSRAIVGIGYGLALMASQGFVIAHTSQKTKAHGLAFLFGGLYAGSICGGAIGAFLAEWIDYRYLFLGGALISSTVILYIYLFFKGEEPLPRAVDSRSSNSVAAIAQPLRKGGALADFFLDRSIISLIFFSSLPASIAAVGFLNYFSPIYLNRNGIPQSAIGQVLMIFGITIIYLGPIVSRYVDASRNKPFFIFVGCLLGSSAFLVFQIADGLLAAALAVFLLGLSNSFVLASQSAYALSLGVTRNLGEGTAIGIFRSSSRIGQMLGPIVFSWAIMASSMEQSVTLLGLLYLVTALLFFLCVKKA